MAEMNVTPAQEQHSVESIDVEFFYVAKDTKLPDGTTIHGEFLSPLYAHADNARNALNTISKQCPEAYVIRAVSLFNHSLQEDIAERADLLSRLQ